MTGSPKDKITTAQAAVTVALFTIGASILTLPREATETVDTPDAWIAVILGGLVALVSGYVVIKLSCRFPEKTFYQYSPIVIGKFFGWICSLLLILYFILVIGYDTRILSELARTYLLDKTPIPVIAILFLGVGVYLIVGGINPIVRLMESYFPIITVLIFLTMFLGLKKFEPDNLRPVLAQGVMPVFKGIKVTLLACLGYEIMLILTAFMKKPNKALKAVLTGVSIPILFYIIIMIVTVGALTAEEVKTLTWPVATLSMEIEIPGGFIESFEVIFIFLWTLTIYTTFVLSYYFAGLGLSQLFQKDINYFIYGLLPIIYIIAMLPPDLDSVFKLGDYVSYIGVIAGGLVPLMLLSIASIRGIDYGKK
jgi:spore germination protein